MKEYVNNKHVLIYSYITLPTGSAASKRVMTIAKGLSDLNYKVDIVSCKNHSVENYVNDKYTEKNNGVRYTIFISKKNILNKGIASVLLRKIHTLFKKKILFYIRSLFIVNNILRYNKKTILIIYGRSGLVYLPVMLLAKLHSVCLLNDMTEWFTIEKYKLGYINPYYYDQLLGRLFIVWFDTAVICISEYIKNQFCKKNKKILLIPALLDTSVIKKMQVNVSEQKHFNICYSGSYKKTDGVHNLLEIIRRINDDGILVKLVMLGLNSNNEYKRSLLDYINNSTDTDKYITTYSWLEENTYQRVLMQSDCLILPRLNKLENIASFPTRLPEYLATSNPVITANMPDINKYLTDKVNSYLVDFEDYNSVFNTIKYVYKNKEERQKIGSKGQELALKEFDYKLHCKNLDSFLCQLT